MTNREREKEEQMLKIETYSLKGTKLSPTTLPKSFEEKENLKLLAQAVRVYESKSHIGLVKTQTRAEVNRTKKKLYKQKGTGGARHGARSAPIFVGGGVAHGPRPLKRILVLPAKLRQKALGIALTLKTKNGEVFAVSGLSGIKKTREAKSLIEKIGGGKFTFVLKDVNSKIVMSLRNLKSTTILSFNELNAYKILLGGKIIFEKEIFEPRKEKKLKIRKEIKK
jgi:large subunit ribosomal protein L4